MSLVLQTDSLILCNPLILCRSPHSLCAPTHLLPRTSYNMELAPSEPLISESLQVSPENY